ncbi:hypothetical protein MA4S0116R_3585 [Mycobacteroides abscessus 4S-0116-R]|nr:hypothetical protein MA4S0303_3612 [Mycobacteroides abscessus 4S-0303]EIV47598.1 hypothetical protein MA4S0116R_3585 [Mycobacteroides abscessus 4S-0116-R]
MGYDMTAPQIHPELTDAMVRQRTVEHIVHTLQHLPNGWTASFERPGRKPSGASSGPVGPDGSWNLYVRYWILGYGDLPGDDVFDAFANLWASWGWIESVDPASSQTRAALGRTPDQYQCEIARGINGGVSTTWMSPYFPASGSAYGGVMPSIITKDGPQSYEQPQRD